MNRWLATTTGVLSLFAAPAVVSAVQPAPGRGVEILEPAAWSGPGTRGIEVRARSSLRVVGLASDPSGIGKVLIAGVPASLASEADGRVRFSGFVRVEAGVSAVEVVAYPMVGPPIARGFGIVPGTARSQELPERASSEAVSGFGGERWAVIVGVGAYRDPRIPALRYADDDALAFRDLLASEVAGLGGFAPDHMRVLVNEEATALAIRSALLTWLRGATEDDIVVVYFAGHGAPDPARLQDHYLLPWDTDLDDLPATALLMEDVSDAIQRVYHRHLILIADACHSAAVGGQTTTRALALNAVNSAFLDRVRSSTGGQVVFTASQVNQLSQEDARWGGGHGVFTHFLLEGLRGRADEDGDRIVTLGEVMEFVRDTVRRETRNAQIPTISQTSFDWYLPLAIARADYTGPAGDTVRPREAAEAVARPVEARPADPLPPPGPHATRPLPRVGVVVELDSDLEGAGVDALARLLRSEVEGLLREAGMVVSDLAADSSAADVVIAATGTLADQGATAGGMRSTGLQIALSARERGGTVYLATAAQRASGAGLSPVAAGRAAMERGARAAAAELVEGLKAAWQTQEEESFRILVRVSGLRGYGQVVWLTGNLGAAVPESAGIVERSADLGTGVAELEWFVPLPAQEVARAIQRHRFAEHDIEITKVAPGLVELRIAAR